LIGTTIIGLLDIVFHYIFESQVIDLIHNRAQVTVSFPEPLHHINRQDIQVFLSVATRPQVESINNWISGICKDYPGIIPLGAMHPEHPYPEAEILWMRQPGIKGIKLRSRRPRTLLRFVIGIGMMLGFKIIIIFLSTIPFSKISLSEPLLTHKIFGTSTHLV